MRIPGSEFPGLPKPGSPGTGGKTAGLRGPPSQAAVRPAPDSLPDARSPQGSPGGRIPPALSSLLSQLKLPVDGLSASIVSFVKFFSLPLDPALLAKIRRQTLPVISGPEDSRPGENPDPLIREARSLACAAALGKGVALNAEGLDRYARMISGSFPEPAKGGEGSEGSPANPETGGGSGGEGGGNKNGKPGGGGNREGDPETLRNLARKAEAGEPLLELLNPIPGKDGKRWLVIPLPIEDGGVRLRVTLRLLLGPSAGTPGEVEQMAVEINGDRRRWLFCYRPGAVLQAALWPETGEGERAGLEQELAEWLGLAPGQVKIGGWNPLFAPDCRNDLFSLREEV